MQINTINEQAVYSDGKTGALYVRSTVLEDGSTVAISNKGFVKVQPASGRACSGQPAKFWATHGSDGIKAFLRHAEVARFTMSKAEREAAEDKATLEALIEKNREECPGLPENKIVALAWMDFRAKHNRDPKSLKY